MLRQITYPTEEHIAKGTRELRCNTRVRSLHFLYSLLKGNALCFNESMALFKATEEFLCSSAVANADGVSDRLQSDRYLWRADPICLLEGFVVRRQRKFKELAL